MCQYFEEFGWKPYILTTESNGTLNTTVTDNQIFRIGTHPQKDSRIEKKNVPVNDDRTGSPVRFLKSILSSFDIEIFNWRLRSFDHTMLGWNKLVSKHLDHILESIPEPDAVIGSYSPSASLAIASKIANKKKIPWIADFRDLGALSVRESNRKIQWLDKMVEKRMIKSASAITSVSFNYRDEFQRVYQIRSETIYNGFHQKYHESGKPPLLRPADQQVKSSYIFHAGRLYPHRMAGFKILLDALKEVRDLVLFFRSLGPDELEEELIDYAKKIGVSEQLLIKEPVDPDTIEAENRNATVALVVESLDMTEKVERGFLSGKFLQLLPGEIPILSICRADNEMKAILQQTGKGSVCSTVEEIKSYLNRVQNNEIQFKVNDKKIEDYSTKRQAEKFCNLLTDISQ